MLGFLTMSAAFLSRSAAVAREKSTGESVALIQPFRRGLFGNFARRLMADVRSLRAAHPTAPLPKSPPVMFCRRPGCGTALPAHEGRGRPKIYCGDECASLFVSERRAVIAEIVRIVAIARQYGPVDMRELMTEDIGVPVPDLQPVLEAASRACKRLVEEDSIDERPREVLVQARAALDLAATLLARHG
jgi:hypothetical protein